MLNMYRPCLYQVSLVVEDGPSGPRLMLPAVIEGEPVTSGHTPPVGEI